MDANELYHYGVKGMKWGRRRSSSSQTSVKKRSTDGWSDEAKEASRLKTKSVSQMTNAELKRLTERQNLEQNYARLNPSRVKKGMAAVKTLAGVMSTALNIYNNSDKIVKAGRRVASTMLK